MRPADDAAGHHGIAGPEVLSRVHREHWARLMALLAGDHGLTEAEDALAEAFARAAATWPAAGPPDNPPAWLLTVARRVATDSRRREIVLHRKLPLLVGDETYDPTPDADADTYPDDRLRLMATCAHPSLPAVDRLALTLRFVAGLDTAAIAGLLLVSPPTMSARLTRAKKRVQTLAIPYEVPARHELPQRLSTIRRVLYLMFTAGYGDPARIELAVEAIRLTRMLDEVSADEVDNVSLLALMLLQHSRRDARHRADGALVLLADQDRTRWHHDEVTQALRLLVTAPTRVSDYHVQALIAAEHAIAPDDRSTDWARIESLYADLERVTSSPIVRLNRAVAVLHVHGPEAALQLLDGLAGTLSTHHLFFATRADLRRRLGDRRAADDYRTARELAPTDQERRFCADRLAELPGRAG